MDTGELKSANPSVVLSRLSFVVLRRTVPSGRVSLDGGGGKRPGGFAEVSRAV
jgi:hypothetical protein